MALDPALVARFNKGETVIEQGGKYYCIAPMGNKHCCQVAANDTRMSPLAHVTKNGKTFWICPRHSKDLVENHSLTPPRVIDSSKIKLDGSTPIEEIYKDTPTMNPVDNTKEAEALKNHLNEKPKEFSLSISISLEDLKGNLNKMLLTKLNESIEEAPPLPFKVTKQLIAVQEQIQKEISNGNNSTKLKRTASAEE